MTRTVTFGLLACLAACSSNEGAAPSTGTPAPSSASADVIEVSASGDSSAYTFAVTVRSPDTGCDRYADWWEVVTPSGELVHRRILAHSHPNEQPFTRSGGPVSIDATDEVVVRAHLSVGGYGQPMRGSVTTGWSGADLAADFAPAVEKAPPQPDGCAF